MTTDFEKKESDSDWENRRLCPDGNCIGVIGKDGFCRECGMPGGEPAEIVQIKPGDSHIAADSADTGIESEPDWEDRKLCPDGSCIGVIGPDGRCKECGREA
jgi:hypothetical protein